MKPSLQFSVPCLNIPDDPDRPPTFEHIFYELPSPEFPFRLDFFLANGWANGLGSFTQSVKILKPDRSVLVQTSSDNPQTFQLRKQTEPYMIVNKFEGVQFDGPGTCWFQIFLDGQMVLEYPLEIRQV